MRTGLFSGIASMAFATCCAGQNLVPNGSFELFTLCPVGFSQFNGYVANWSDPSTATPDYMNACANPFPAGVPHNGTGWQQAHTGSGYAGFYTFSGTLYREFVQVQTTTPLTAGTTYFFSMYVVLHNRSQTAVDDIGVCITTAQPTSTGTGLLSGNPQPQIANPFGNVITDSLNWTLISGLYTALGGERYVTIGHFKSDAQTTYQTVSYGSQGAYYYVDDVQLISVNVLPVELVAFNAAATEGKVQLTWTTASETNNAGFHVERSMDGEHFEELGWVQGAGGSVSERNYAFADNDAPAGATIFYRLEQEDFDGHRTPSPVISIWSGSNSTASPRALSNGHVLVQITGDQEMIMTVSDANGRCLGSRRQPISAGPHELDPFEGLADPLPGLYLVSVKLRGSEQCVAMPFVGR